MHHRSWWGAPAEEAVFVRRSVRVQLTSYTGASMTIFVYVTPSDNAANDLKFSAVKQALAPSLAVSRAQARRPPPF